MADSFDWVCPFCNRAQVVSGAQFSSNHNHLYVGTLSDGPTGVTSAAISCASPECRKLTLSVVVHGDRLAGGSWVRDINKTFIQRRLLPEGLGKPQPDYIPVALRNDYHEASLIAEFSPKAAATLARRCIQGMIRDFCGINKPRLIDEIRALRAAVDDGTAPRSVSLESVAAIDHVREIGNIGAHMEHDINQIIDVDPGEAKALLELIELLFSEWYVERHFRQQRLARVNSIGEGKRQLKSTTRPLLS